MTLLSFGNWAFPKEKGCIAAGRAIYFRIISFKA